MGNKLERLQGSSRKNSSADTWASDNSKSRNQITSPRSSLAVVDDIHLHSPLTSSTPSRSDAALPLSKSSLVPNTVGNDSNTISLLAGNHSTQSRIDRRGSSVESLSVSSSIHSYSHYSEDSATPRSSREPHSGDAITWIKGFFKKVGHLMVLTNVMPTNYGYLYHSCALTKKGDIGSLMNTL